MCASGGMTGFPVINPLAVSPTDADTVLGLTGQQTAHSNQKDHNFIVCIRHYLYWVGKPYLSLTYYLDIHNILHYLLQTV